MLRKKIVAFSLFFLFCLVHSFSQTIFSVQLNDINGKVFLLSKLSENKISVLVFYDTDCPLCKNYTLTLNNLCTKYAASKTGFYLVFPQQKIDRGKLIEYQNKYKIKATMLTDGLHKTVKILKATVTPEVFVINNKGNILYSGSIDNWMYATGKKRTVVTEHYLEDALKTISENKIPEVKSTKAYGCIIE